MAHNTYWRKSVIGLLIVVVSLATLNLHLLGQLVDRIPDTDRLSDLVERFCADNPKRGQIYVPAYSHIYRDGLPTLLEVALSLRNTDPNADITIDRVDYFDDEGKLLRRFLDQSLVLKPLMSAEYLIEKADFKGGMGANFLISWSASKSPSPPLADALMTGGRKDQWISFGSHGVAVQLDGTGRPCR